MSCLRKILIVIFVIIEGACEMLLLVNDDFKLCSGYAISAVVAQTAPVFI